MTSILARRWRALPAAVLALSLLLPAAAPPALAAQPTELFFSEYIEGSSNNKALEIYNGTGAAVDLAAGGYNVFMSFNGGTATLTINLTGTVADGDVFVLAQSSASAAILAQADQTNGSGWYNGDDAVVLRKGTAAVDAIGQVGFDPGTEWGTGLTSTADNTLRRKATIGAGDTNETDAFDPAVEWDGFATDTFDGLGSHTFTPPDVDLAPAVAATTPAGGASVAADATLSVTFSEPVDVAGTWFTLECSTTDAVTATVSGGPTTFTIDPDADLASGESCTLTIVAAQVSDQDTDDPPDTMVSDVVVAFSVVDCSTPYTHAGQIQGSGASAAVTGPVVTQGVVVGDYELPAGSGQIRGFYLQDAAADGDPATSDGLFVFTGGTDRAALGRLVRVTGTAGDFQDQTQVSGVTAVADCGPGSVAPTDISFPVSSPTFLERYEGMLVRVPQPMTVTEHFQLGRFGQVTVSADGRLRQPTSVVEPGDPAAGLQAANNLRRIIVDDANNQQNADPIVFGRGGNPLSASNTLRGGDTASDTVGVLVYDWAGNAASGNAYRIRPLNALGGHVEFDAVNDRPSGPPDVGGTLRVAGMNLLNFFNTFDGLPDTVNNCRGGVGGATMDCRGADTAAEFARQVPKTVAAIVALDADVVGINEIENDGYGPDSAIAFLVDELNEATAPGTWAYVDVDAETGQVNALGTDAIKVGMVYRPDAVVPIGRTSALNSVEFVNGGDGAPRSRPSLAQAFETVATGARVVVDINHLKSKGSACDAPDAGDGQGNCNAVRTNAAHALVDWLATDPTLAGDADVLLVGDYNSYAKEDPIGALEQGGYTNLIADRLGQDAYSYVFDGQWGYLDYALGSPSVLAQVTGVGDYHINADEPSVLDYNTDFKTANLQAVLYAPDEFRVSDHDVALVGLDLAADPLSTRPATGTGWIASPPGAYAGAPDAAAKADFAFDAKYAKGGTALQGSASLSFPAGGFSFVATSLDRLVTNGSLATLQGTGSVNGAGAYAFRLSAVDGTPDRFRLQVRDADGAVVYDNGGLQALGGGSVQLRPPK